MIRLLIVDDEATTRDSLLELVPWSDMGIDEVRAAENGIAALAACERFVPSILLTDIRMPKMNGIDLSKKVRELYPDCEIVFLSGYSDKEYLKSAIQVSAADYLDKPVDLGELTALFKSIVRKVWDASARSSAGEQLIDSLNKNLHLLRQDWIIELLAGKSSIGELLDRYGSDKLRLSANLPHSVACVMLNWNIAAEEEEKSYVRGEIVKKLNDMVEYGDIPFLAGFLQPSGLALIVQEHERGGEPVALPLLSRLRECLLTAFPDRFTIAAAYGPPTADYGMLVEQYRRVMEATKQQFYEGTNRIFLSSSANSSSFQMDKKVYESYKGLLRAGSADEASGLVRRLTASIESTRDPNTNTVRNVYFNLLRLLYEATMQWDILEGRDDLGKKYIWQEIDAKLTLNELTDFVVKHIETVFKRNEQKDGSVDKIDEILKYIAEQYSNSQLSIQSIAERTYLSPTYLCAFFKKSTGKTVNEYITSLRMEKAMLLLEDRKIKLHQISAGIGFTDSNYFSTLFKKHTGLTPSEFRERLSHGQTNR